MSAPTADDKAKFKKLCTLVYKDQAVWFMNGFWGDGISGTEANDIWTFCKAFVELDKLGHEKKGEKGNELDQFWSAKFLEDHASALTALQRKEALKTIDVDNNGKMSLIEYLIFKYKKTVSETNSAPQGDNAAAIKAAQQKVDAVLVQLRECEANLEKQKEAVAANEEAKKKLIAEEEALWFAEAELKKAVEELNKQEAEYKNKIAALESTIAKETGMKQAKAKNELSQLKGEDPLPLRRAKITQEAALRKVQKQKAAVVVAKEDLERKGVQLEKAVAELEASYLKLESKLNEAREELERIKARPGGGKGAIWWMEREMFEIDARLPTSKMRFDHKKPFMFNP